MPVKAMKILEVTPKAIPFHDMLPREFSSFTPKIKPAITRRQHPKIGKDIFFLRIIIENNTMKIIVVERAI